MISLEEVLGLCATNFLLIRTADGVYSPCKPCQVSKEATLFLLHFVLCMFTESLVECMHVCKGSCMLLYNTNIHLYCMCACMEI